MAMQTGDILAGAIGGPIGLAAAAGSKKDETKQTSTRDIAPASAYENSLQDSVQNQYGKLGELTDAGPGASDVTAGTTASREYADLLKQYQNGGYMPSGSDISSSNSLAQQLFNPQRTAMNQAFSDQSVQANRQAALMGRDMNDPILRAKLAQEQTRQGAMLDANQGAWSTNYAMQQPGMRLGYAADRTNVLQGLASQAMSNRQALLGMGSNLLGNERGFRLGASGNTSTMESGGGLKGAMAGGMAMAGTVASIGGMAGGMPSGGMGGGQMGASQVSQMQMAPQQQYNPNYFQQSNPYSSSGQGLAYNSSPRTFNLGGGH